METVNATNVKLKSISVVIRILEKGREEYLELKRDLIPSDTNIDSKSALYINQGIDKHKNKRIPLERFGLSMLERLGFHIEIEFKETGE